MDNRIANQTLKIALMTFVSIFLSLFVLNRWAFTPLGYKSFGRVWQLYVSWSDFGFFRRGLLGTILTETGVNSLIKNEYVFAYIFYTLALLLLYAIVVTIIYKADDLYKNTLLIACIMFSPALFMHFAYATSGQDIYILIIAFLCVYFIKNIFVFPLLICCGLLVHELFFFMLPCILILRYLEGARRNPFQDRILLTSGFVALVTMAVLVVFGKLNVNQEVFDSLMAARMPNAAHQHAFWSGYFEVSSSVKSNANLGSEFIDQFLKERKDQLSVVIPTLYAIYVAVIVAWYSKISLFEKVALFICCIFPHAVVLVASEYYRWTSLSACLGLISIMFLISKKMLSVPNSALLVLLIFSVFSPFGSIPLDRPFPMQQFAIEKFFQR
jgi:hypothetical protein